MPLYVVSACLAGVCCRYDGAHARHEGVALLWREGRALALCPEVLGGLSTPRPPCEIREGGVFTATGVDCTSAYVAGVREAMRQTLLCGCAAAILQPRSPSCGVRQVYDGTFQRQRVPGAGLWAQALRAAGVAVYEPEDMEDLLKTGQCIDRPGNVGVQKESKFSIAQVILSHP